MFDTQLLIKLLPQCQGLWQMPIYDPVQFARFSRDRAVGFRDQHIVMLWQLALLRADLVTSANEVEQPGFLNIGVTPDGRYLYADRREFSQVDSNLTGALSAEPSVPITNVELSFHPFRYYVLYHLHRVMKLYINPIQVLNADRYSALLEREIKHFQEWTESDEFSKLINRWNDISSLAAVSEPCTYEVVFGSIGWPSHVGEEAFREHLYAYYEELQALYEGLNRVEIDSVREELCVNSEMLDSNASIHTLLRLSSRDVRINLRGAIGGALHLKTMAEMIRRVAEDCLGIEFPEEDEVGLGRWPRGAKERLYGSNRIFDQDRGIALQVVRQALLDYGIRLRWYVEGDTEYAAIRSIVEQYPVGIEVINLRGQVVQRGGRGLAFRESLRTDIRTTIFSFVSLDGDRDDYERAARIAAREDELFGRFFIATPDFEFENFGLDELEEVIWSIAEENGASADGREKVHEAIQGVENADELIKQARESLPQLAHLSKGEEWGEQLARYAWQNRNRPDGSIRPIVDHIETAMGADFYDYHTTRQKFRVSPQTGELVER